MAGNLRKTGISVVGDVPWGTHFCTFYETTKDLLDILVPFFKAGLESKEFCLWIVSDSELLTMQEATSALRKVAPDLDRYLSEGSIELVPHHKWFLEGGTFDLRRVASRFGEKLDDALARGYAGMRVNGSPAWLYKDNGKELVSYEKEVDKLFPDLSIIASCTYPIADSATAELLDVARAHRFLITRRHGNWEVHETPELIQAKQEIKKLNEELEQRVIERTKELQAKEEALKESQRLLEEAQRIAHIGHYEHDLDTGIITASDENYRILGLEPQDSIALSRSLDLIHPDDCERVNRERDEAVRTGQHFDIEFRMVRPDGEVRYIHSHGDVICDEEGRARKTFGVAQDITESKQGEIALRAQKEILQKIVDHIPVMINFTGSDGLITLVNREWEHTLGWSLEEIRRENIDIFAECYPDHAERQRLTDFLTAATVA